VSVVGPAPSTPHSFAARAGWGIAVSSAMATDMVETVNPEALPEMQPSGAVAEWSPLLDMRRLNLGSPSHDFIRNIPSN
jgi:hypothetical protein